MKYVKQIIYYSVIILALSMSVTGQAKVLPTQGQTFAIKEQDFRQFIQQRLAYMKKTGQIKQYEQAAQKRVAKHVYHPPTLPLGTQSDTQTYYIDPSIKLTRPIADNLGRVLIPAGTIINPFKTVHLKEVLIFFNGNDKQQVVWFNIITKNINGSSSF